jgi:phosphoenolpyruvate carboxykinase (ATP)
VAIYKSSFGLENHGFQNLDGEYWNLSTPALYEQIVRFREGVISHLGPVVVNTGEHTGRSPKDKFIVSEPDSEQHVWWGKVNVPISYVCYENLRRRMLAYFQGRAAFVQDCFAGQDPAYRVPIRIITENAWQSLFARNMFAQATPEDLANHIPEYTVIAAPNFHAVPEIDGTNSSAFIVLDLDEKLVLIGGTRYAGEIKKSVFTIMNYLMPLEGVMSMHCSANYGSNPDDVAIFFGLSGTGKTTLSADATRTLIGDDEHGWSDRGVFNYEGGCYAKMIRLSEEGEPEIYATTRSFGTVLENVMVDVNTRHIDLDDNTFTENTRGAYPLTHIPNASRSGMAGHPKHIFFLTADAFGVLPPISRLSPEQAQYHFLAGYTAKVAGTEKGLGSEPQAVFSTCFGAPFMVHHPTVYAELLSQKIREHGCKVWLVNTGWTGGPHGVGNRMKLAHTRAMIRAALESGLDDVPMQTDPVFGVQVPLHVPGVPDEILMARDTWADPVAYDAQARKLAQMFNEHFAEYAEHASEAVRGAGPQLELIR